MSLFMLFLSGRILGPHKAVTFAQTREKLFTEMTILFPTLSSSLSPSSPSFVLSHSPFSVSISKFSLGSTPVSLSSVYAGTPEGVGPVKAGQKITAGITGLSDFDIHFDVAKRRRPGNY